MTWVLILFIYAGVWAKGDSVALTTVPGFKTEQECRVAGEATKKFVEETTKAQKYVCVYQTRERTP